MDDVMGDADEPTAAVAAIYLRLPKFWPADPQVWFGQVESQFITARVTSQVAKFHHVIAAQPPEVATEVRDFVIATPEDRPYDELRSALIQRTSASEQRKLQQLLTSEELGARKISQTMQQNLFP